MELWEKKLVEFCVRQGHLSPEQANEFIDIQKNSLQKRHLLSLFMEYMNWSVEDAKNTCRCILSEEEMAHVDYLLSQSQSVWLIPDEDSDATFVEDASETEVEKNSGFVFSKHKVEDSPVSFFAKISETQDNASVTNTDDALKETFTIAKYPYKSSIYSRRK